MQPVEPIMTVEITAPDEFQGAVMGGANKRNGTILGSSNGDGYFTIDAEVRDGLGWGRGKQKEDMSFISKGYGSLIRLQLWPHSLRPATA